MKYLILVLILFVSLSSSAQKKIIITHGPYIQCLSENEAVISWTTNVDAVSWVELAPNDSTHFYLKERPKFFSAPYGTKEISKVHNIRLNKLQSGTTYRYRIFSKEVLVHEGSKVQYGDVVATDVYGKRPLTFTTAGKTTESKVSFVVVNDIHGKNDLLESLLTIGDVKTAGFVIFNGDMVSDMRSEEQVFGGFVDTAVKVFAKSKPFYYARGNHETRGDFSNMFSRYFADPSGKLYYLVRRGPVCFVVLDSGEDKPDSDMEYCDIADFEEYRTQQSEWLREAVKSPEFTSAPFKVAVVHIPPLGSWRGDADVLEKFVPVLNEAKVDVMLCGHLHKYLRIEPSKEINFPIIVNPNNGVIRGESDGDKLQLKIISNKGEQLDVFQLKK
jgi:Predicted phosphohydrolases